MRRKQGCPRLAGGYRLATVFALAALAGCDPDSVTMTTLQGTVADGYLVGAKVCLDRNANAVCDDASEPHATTTAGGAYRLVVLAPEATLYRLLVEVPATAIDEDTGVAVGAAFLLTAPTGRHAVINPVTTLVAMQMRAHGSTEAQATALLAPQLQVTSPATLLEDYAAAGATTEQQALHNFARVAAGRLAQDQAAIASALGGSIAPALRASVLAMTSSNLLMQAAAIRAQVAAVMTAPQLAAVSTVAVDTGVSGAVLAERLLFADVAPAGALASDLQQGLCGITHANLFTADCHYLLAGELVTRRWSQSRIDLAATESESDEPMQRRNAGAWTSWDRNHRPAVADGSTVLIRDHASLPGTENWIARVRDISGQPLVGSSANVYPAGSRIYEIRRDVDQPARLQMRQGESPLAAAGVPFATIDAALAHFAAGNAANHRAAYETFYQVVSGCCLTALVSANVMQFDAGGVLLRRNEDAGMGGAPGAIATELFPDGAVVTALPDGTWTRAVIDSVDVISMATGTGEAIAAWIARDGLVYEGENLAASHTVDVLYLRNKAAFVAEKAALCLAC